MDSKKGSFLFVERLFTFSNVANCEKILIIFWFITQLF